MAIEASGHDSTGGRIRLGMVGGGQGAFIGAVHRIAARIDWQFELVAGALYSEPARAKASAVELGIAAERSYGSFEEMARAEAARPDGIEAVSIVTPNHVHAPAAHAFLEAGIHVICDKPMTTTVAEAQGLVDLVEKSGNRVAHRSKAVWGWRLHRRYRNERLQSRCFRHRTGDRCTPGAAHHLRAWPPARRRRPDPVALHGRRAWHAVGEPGGGRQRKWPQAAHLRHQGWARMDAGRSELSMVHPFWPAEAVAHPRRCGGAAGSRPRHPRAERTPRGVSRGLCHNLCRSCARNPRSADRRFTRYRNDLSDRP